MTFSWLSTQQLGFIAPSAINHSYKSTSISVVDKQCPAFISANITRLRNKHPALFICSLSRLSFCTMGENIMLGSPSAGGLPACILRCIVRTVVISTHHLGACVSWSGESHRKNTSRRVHCSGHHR